MENKTMFNNGMKVLDEYTIPSRGVTHATPMIIRDIAVRCNVVVIATAPLNSASPTNLCIMVGKKRNGKTVQIYIADIVEIIHANHYINVPTPEINEGESYFVSCTVEEGKEIAATIIVFESEAYQQPDSTFNGESNKLTWSNFYE